MIKRNLRGFVNAYFRTLSIIFFLLFVIYSILSIGSEDYLRSLTSLISYSILPVVLGNTIVAIVYFYIKQKSIK
ncbi:hypothetical protein A9Q93_07945 [Nonlabens dokdonensis]|uniref:Uncharacterized protein n=1 Tax=Nonlabens dokdonensis TaxID=328515 RepID=A0A1Z8AW24_9FLAO|nr:hypothetical protein [Nonlabens dokdonensis]OUS14525.1 hypothetical protein A9Q93_07945 [Nonlabens dokdonensis]